MSLDDESIAQSLAVLNGDNLSAENLNSSNLAYVIYTSGSTGAPKGVLVEHGNVVRLFKTSESLFGFDSNDCWTLFHSYAFDFSVWEFWGALAYGGKLVVVPFATSRSPEDFYQLLIKECVTVLNQTPSAFYMFSEHCQNAQAELPLRYVIFGGEALETRKLKAWFEQYDEQKIRLINMYGITETTVHVTFRQITANDCDNSGSPIGKPLADLTAYILDDNMQVVPKGEVGELFVGGAGVTRGYLNRSELTAQRFVAAPEAIAGNERLYRTGDLVKQTQDGELEYIGRCDFQVKIRGFRIELGEIEAKLEQHFSVKSAIVLLQQNADGNEHLAAFVIKADSSIDNQLPQTLIEHLSTQVPEYMVPAAFMVMDEFPLTTNGKIDRKALPQATAVQTSQYLGAQTPMQERILTIWQVVLKRDKISIKDNFFAIGGDSILSLKVISKLKKQGIVIKATDMYVHQSIEALALLVGDSNEQPVVEQTHQPFALVDEKDLEKIDRDIIEDAYPLSYLQQGMIFHDLDSSKANVYHTVAGYEIEAPFEPVAFEKTLAQLVQQHELLRTAIDLDGYSMPLQLVYRQATIPLTVDTTALNDPQQQKVHYQKWLEQELKNNFDWAHAPLIRVFVHVYRDNVFRMSWSMHHAVEDGWSESVLFTELVRRYKANLLAEATKVTPYKTRYRDFVEAELKACADAAQQQFWQQELSDFEPLKLAQGVAQDPLPDSVRYEDFVIEGAAFQKLKLVGSIAGVSQKTIFMAAHLKTLSILTGRDDVATGMVVHGRPDNEDSGKVFGCFLNTLVMRYALADENWMTLLRKIDAKDNALFAQRYFPLLEICNVSGIKAPFDVLFNYVRFHDFDALEKSDGDFSRSGFANTTYPMDVNFIDGESSVIGSLAWNSQALDKSIVKAYISTISLILNQMADHLANVHHKAHYVDDASVEAYRQLNEQSCQYDDPESLLQRFAVQVAQQPERIVLQSEDRQLSFSRLDEQSNQLARYLQSHGVEYQSTVAVCMEHCSDLLISILAILKIGGVYVPVDPANPSERINYVLQDSEAKLLLTSSAHTDSIDELDIEVLEVDQFDYSQSAEPIENAQPFDKQALAYIIYTSGSTGTPKGVMVPHRGIGYLLNAYHEKLKLNSDIRMLQYTSIGFDISLSEIFSVLITGGTLYVPSREVKGELQQLQQFINANGISHSFLPQALLPLLDPAECPSLNFVVVGGERMALNSVKSWTQGRHFYHAYGLTECTVDSSMHRVSPDDKVLSIGAPFIGSRYHILDKRKNPVPLGVVGELYVAGQGVAKGYLNDAEKTAAVFIDSPFEPGQKLFKTGDLVRYHGNDCLEFVDRVDNQVKLRGFRIELGEIEQQIAMCDGVASTVVIVCEDTLGDKRLVAYILRDDSQNQDDGEFVSALKLKLQQKLPNYMVPGAILTVETFVLNKWQD